MEYVSALQLWGEQYPDLLEALLSQGSQQPQNPGGVDGGAGPDIGGSGIDVPSNVPNYRGSGAPDLPAGWLQNIHHANSPQADSYFRKAKAADIATNPITKYLIGALSPVPGVGSAVNLWGQAVQQSNYDDFLFNMGYGWHTPSNYNQSP